MANGKSETCRDAEIGILKSETETEKFSDLIEKHICDRQTQNLRLRDPLLGCARFRDLVEFAEISHFLLDYCTYHPPLASFVSSSHNFKFSIFSLYKIDTDGIPFSNVQWILEMSKCGVMSLFNRFF